MFVYLYVLCYIMSATNMGLSWIRQVYV